MVSTPTSRTPQGSTSLLLLVAVTERVTTTCTATRFRWLRWRHERTRLRIYLNGVVFPVRDMTARRTSNGGAGGGYSTEPKVNANGKPCIGGDGFDLVTALTLT